MYGRAYVYCLPSLPRSLMRASAWPWHSAACTMPRTHHVKCPLLDPSTTLLAAQGRMSESPQQTRRAAQSGACCRSDVAVNTALLLCCLMGPLCCARRRGREHAAGGGAAQPGPRNARAPGGVPALAAARARHGGERIQIQITSLPATSGRSDVWLSLDKPVATKEHVLPWPPALQLPC